MIIEIKETKNGEQPCIRINLKYIERCRKELEQQEEEAKETARKEVEMEKEYPIMKTVNRFMWGFTSFLSCLMEGDFSEENRRGHRPYYRKYKQYWEEHYND